MGRICGEQAMKIEFILNGERRALSVAPNEILLEVLRERLGIKSPKIGCEEGDCGACTVLLDGRTVRSCLILAVEVDGHDVTTLEGLETGGPTPLQKALHHRNAFQCGFCAPGMILSATEALEKSPDATEEELRAALAGNLCRCTGYQPIVEAALEVGRQRKTRSRRRKKADSPCEG